jgi:S1-C subfamily serine protease
MLYPNNVGGVMLRAGIAVFALLAFLAPSLFFTPVANSQDAEIVATAAKPSVGAILAERADGTFSGTAFMAADRLVLTAYHVVEGARRILLKFPDYPAVDARVVGGNVNDDVAVLSIPGLPVRSLPLRRHWTGS